MLAAWSGSPTRFREDANAEDDLLRDGYADRWFVELAQNAADAARRAGEPGRVRLRVVPGPRPELRVANTGAPLDAAGVAALSSLRASAKRDDEAVGRFGVGFAAVLAVTDEPALVSTSGGVAFSSARTASEVRALGGASAVELARREGRGPVLRLCWPAPALPGDDGYATEARLPLRAGLDPDELLAGARADAADLLLALPWLARIELSGPGEPTLVWRVDEPGGVVRLEPGGRRWLLVRRSGRLPGADVGVEERGDWSVCWALPVAADRGPRPLEPDVLHAPTPSDERLSLPARLLAELPMQPSRRRVRGGPATDAVLAEAAKGYLELVRAVPPEHRAVLAPRPGFPVSELDAALRERIGAVLASAAWLPSAADADPVAPRAAVLLEDASGGLAELLADAVPGLVDPASVGTASRPALTALGARTATLAELADRLAGLGRESRWWRSLYRELAPVLERRPGARDELAALPVPLADGRTLAGPRGVLVPELPSGLIDAAAEAELTGLRIAHPDAVHPLLLRLGAVAAGPGELLDHPAVTAAVAESVADAEDGLDRAPLARFVLALVTELGGALTPRPWLAALALPDAEGEPRRADELMLPDAAVAGLLVADAPIGVLAAEVARAYPRPVLTSVGVLDGFAVLTDPAPTGPEHELADEEAWWACCEARGEPPRRLVAVRDLDLVDDDAWPAALRLLAGDPAARAALRRERPDDPPTYTQWWLARFALLAGRRPTHWRLRSAAHLGGLFDPLPPLAAPLDEELLAAIGVRRDLAVADGEQAGELLDRLADPDRSADARLAWWAHAALAEAVLSGSANPAEVPPPARLRAMDGGVCDAGRAVLLDAAWLAPALPPGETVGGRLDADGVAALAELLDLPLASEVVAGTVAGEGAEVVRWARLPEVVTVCAALGVPVPAGSLWLHRRLTVQLSRPTRGRIEVPAWRADGRWHAADPVRALLGLLGDEEPSKITRMG